MDYELYKLGWKSFQQLCLTVTREIFGQTVESYLDSNDGGRDGAFSGIWRSVGSESLSGRFVIQCKFTSIASHNLSVSEVSSEITKAKGLVDRGLCDNYILITNAGVSGTQTEAIESAFKDVGVREVRVYGSSWLSDQIAENSRLRMLVPRLYGLGDLSQILDERAYAQATALLESLKDDLAKVVITKPYQDAVQALNEHGFVLLVGEPAVGKTTIASLLSMAALDQWAAPTMKLDIPADLTQHWNPNEPAQFFWIDDAFGVTQYESGLAFGWNHAFPKIKVMVERGARIVMTSRDYIYNRARDDLKTGAFPLLNESQVVVDVNDLTIDERRQILYNHLKLGRQTKEFLSEIKPFLEFVAAHDRFSPEMARRLSDPNFTKDLGLNRYSIGAFVQNQQSLLEEVLRGLDDDSKAAVALIYMRSGNLTTPITIDADEENALRLFDSSLGGCRKALAALRGSLVSLNQKEGEKEWSFKHPTIADAYASLLAKDPDLFGIYLHGTSPADLVAQVTCGDVGIEHANTVPTSQFPVMLDKLNQLAHSGSSRYKERWLVSFDSRRSVMNFLAWRSNREFKATYLEAHPELLESVSSPGLMLDTVPEVDLAIALHHDGLLPEEDRRRFVNTIIAYSITGEDLYAYGNESLLAVFTTEELEELHTRTEEDLLPELSSIASDWESNCPLDTPREAHMGPFLEGLSELTEQFPDSEEDIGSVRRTIESWIQDEPDEVQSTPRRLRTVDNNGGSTSSERSIFDDIDADH